jgi:hypothetical protein
VSDLTDDERAVLQLVDSGKQGGPLVNAIRELGYSSPEKFFQALNALLPTERAEAAYPGLVHRLRRLQAAQARRRYRW